MATGKVKTGDVFNNWTVLSESERDNKRAQQFLCKCICGTQRVVKKYNLGKIKGCGCDRAAPKPYKKRHSKSANKAASVKTVFEPTMQTGPRIKGERLEKPPENNAARPEYIERKKTKRELIELRLEEMKLEKELSEAW
ncbi:MAG: hypothetical protein CML20_11470 [Rheinheimera sp.]|nr:hypothetical protein [Rheinheimera sp.]|tara:strand:- start:2769 stop:3185 length:417 start_codon:yes stop_codon:yes gene_type:complete